MPAAIPIAASMAGAAVTGAMNKKSSGGSSTSSTEPWAPAQDLLKGVLGDAGDLRTYYQQNPFNDLQKTAYQNQFNQLDNFNNQIVPGLMQGLQGLLGPQFGNIGLGASRAQQAQQAPARPAWTQDQLREGGEFIRDNIENPAAVRERAGLLGLTNADLLQAAQTQDPNIRMNQVEQFMGRQDPQYAKQSFGQIDWNTLNPWRNGGIQQVQAQQAQALANETPEQRRLREEQEYWQWMMNYSAGAGTGSAGVGVGGAGDAAAAGAAASAGDGGVSI